MSRPPAPRAPPPVAPQPQQPSLLKQAAATAAGVAVGSAVGHAIGGSLMGGSSQPEAVLAQQPPAPNASNPCQHHIDELVRCSQVNSEISQCQYIAEALKECRRMYNL